MKRLPTTIGSLKKLQVLDLEENKLEFLPPEIGNIPYCIVNYVSLAALDCSDNNNSNNNNNNNNNNIYLTKVFHHAY